MPKQIENPEILELLKKNASEMESIRVRQVALDLEAQQELYPRIDALEVENKKFWDLMNTEYGWGNWQDVNAKDYTFKTREELTEAYYIISNPAIRSKVEVDDVGDGRKVMNDPELCKALDKLLEEQNEVH